MLSFSRTVDYSCEAGRVALESLSLRESPVLTPETTDEESEDEDDAYV